MTITVDTIKVLTADNLVSLKVDAKGGASKKFEIIIKGEGVPEQKPKEEEQKVEKNKEKKEKPVEEASNFTWDYNNSKSHINHKSG